MIVGGSYRSAVGDPYECGHKPCSAGLLRGLAKTCGTLFNGQRKAAGPRKMRVALRYILVAVAQGIECVRCACYVTESECAA